MKGAVVLRNWICGILTLLWTGCASVPGSLRPMSFATSEVRSAAQGRTTTEILASYLEIIARDPESAEAKPAEGRFVQLYRKSANSRTAKIDQWNVRFIGDWPLVYFDSFLPAADYAVHGLKNRHVRPGAGVALVGCRNNSKRERIEAWYPPELIVRPVTAVFRSDPGQNVAIALNDSRRSETLAADFTAPMAHLLGFGRELSGVGFGGLLRADRGRRTFGLYLMEPYDPQKTPVLFVHGLLSTPLAWANTTNELWGDAEFRRRYQIWHYLYPTSAPFLYSAKMLRQQLAETRAFLDPAGNDWASRHLSIVAHSMGGLLTRTLITHSGEAAWNGVFSVPPAALHAAPADRQLVADILHWEPDRSVRRVVFVAVPHRGSTIARGFVGRIGDAIAALPKTFTGVYARLHRDNPTALQPAFRRALSAGELTSIDTLSPRHPLLPVINAMPFAPWITAHSIIGNRGSAGRLERSSDGIVPYTSSHLDQAVSEVVAPTGHSAYDHPVAVAEILRVLKESESE